MKESGDSVGSLLNSTSDFTVFPLFCFGSSVSPGPPFTHLLLSHLEYLFLYFRADHRFVRGVGASGRRCVGASVRLCVGHTFPSNSRKYLGSNSLSSFVQSGVPFVQSGVLFVSQEFVAEEFI